MEEQRQPRLIILSGKKRGGEIDIPTGSATLGRTKDADLVVKDKSISRVHARFEFDGRICTVFDLGSKNGVRVNNRKVDSFSLHTGDTVTLGQVKLKFVDPSELEDPGGRQAAPPPGSAPSFQAPPPPVQEFQAPPPPAEPFPPPQAAPPPAPEPGRYVPPGERTEPAQGQGVLPSGATGAGSQGSAFAPPEDFFNDTPSSQDDDAKPQATIRTLLPYIAAIVIGGVILAFLAYETFREEYKPFREDVPLSVDQTRLFDMLQYISKLRQARCDVADGRVAQVKYDSKTAILTVKGLAMGDTDCVFLIQENTVLGKVRIHVEAKTRKDTADFAAFSDEQLTAQALDLMAQGNSMGIDHLAEALEKYEEAVRIYSILPDSAKGKQEAMEKKFNFRDERKKRVASLIKAFQKAYSTNDLRKAMAYLARIKQLYTDTMNENYQRANIFLDRIRNRLQAANQKKKK